MDFRIDKYLLISIVLIFFACSSDKTKEIEDYSGIDLQNKITFVKDTSHWNNFNGNGFKVLIYEIKNDNLNEIIQSAKQLKYKNLKSYDSEFSNFDITPYIKASQGLFKTEWLDNEIKTIVLDTVNSKLIYYYSIL